MSIDNVIDKVRKLLALAGDASNAHEAAAASGLANKLIDEYRLSEADLEVSDEGHSEPIEEDDGYIYESGKVTEWKKMLVRVLAHHYGCAHWNDTSYSGGRKVSRYKLVGKRSDIGLTRFMFTWLSAECSRLSQLEAKGMGRVFIASYCTGFVAGIAEQLSASRVKAQEHATSAAIVKIDERMKDSTQAMYKLNDNLKKVNTRSQAQMNGVAFSAGHQHGTSLHLGATMGSGSTKHLNK
jgi:hypothetical protein